MKYARIAARLLLGLIFTVFGLNGFFHFIPQPPLPPGLSGEYMTVMAKGGFFPFIFGAQLIGGLLLLAGAFVPLALVILGPIIVNILLFHTLLAPAGIGPGLITLLLWIAVFFSVRDSFAGIFRNRS